MHWPQALGHEPRQSAYEDAHRCVSASQAKCSEDQRKAVVTVESDQDRPQKSEDQDRRDEP